MQNKLPQPSGNWLSGLALWAIIITWAAAGSWGWWTQAPGALMSVLAIALTLGCAVFATRAVKNAAQAETVSRRIALLGLGAACLLFTGWSGHQAVEVSENRRWASYDNAEAAKATNAKLDAQIAALPPIPLSDEAGRPIGPARTRELGALRSNEVARLTGLRVAVATVEKPAARMPKELGWALVALIEALELLGFYAIGSKPREAVVRNAASELARKRWNLA